MKNRVLSGTLGVLAVVLVVAGGAAARSQATTIRLSTALNSGEEVPQPTGDVSGARGTFTATATMTAAGADVAWQMTFSGLTGPATAAHIHTGARGVAGPVSVPLCGPCTSPASGTATVTEPAVLAAIQNGGAYVNVHTNTNRGGEIRGQLSVTAAVRSVLTAAREVPRPTGTKKGARGRFTGTVTKSGATTTLAWRLTFSKLTGPAVAAHIHLGRAGKAGPVVLALCGPCRSGANGRANVRPNLLAALQNGRAYVNVHTARNAAGEIRGQIPRVPLVLG